MPHNGARPPKEGELIATSNVIDKNWKALIKPNKLDITSNEDKTIAKVVAEPLEKALVKLWKFSKKNFIVFYSRCCCCSNSNRWSFT